MQPSEPADKEPGKEHDPETLESVWRHQSPRLRKHLQQRLSDDDAIREILQDTFAAAYEGRMTFRGAGTIEGWLYKICAATCTRYLRDLTRRRRLLDAFELARCGDAVEDVEQALLRRERSEALVTALRKLSSRRRAVVLLRDIQHYSIAMTALTLGCAPGTVKATHYAALRQLRTLLGPTREALGDQPGQPVNPHIPDNPDQPDKPHQPEQPGQPDQPPNPRE